MTKRALVPAVAAVVLLTLSACGGGSSSTAGSPPKSPGTSGSTTGISCSYPAAPEGATKKVSPPPQTPDVSGTVHVTLSTSVGTWHFALDATKTPCTVNSFVSLVKQGYYNKTPCHRLTTANSGIYVLQCGDPTGTGTGGPGYTIPDEVTGKETYPAGTLAMARSSKPNSGGSQFFIVYQNTGLPAQYTVFGKIDPSTLKSIRKVAAAGDDDAFGPGDGRPRTPVTISSVTIG